MSKVKTGITLFSLGTPYLKGELDLEGVIRTAAELGAEGYEIVATQMIPSSRCVRATAARRREDDTDRKPDDRPEPHRTG